MTVTLKDKYDEKNIIKVENVVEVIPNGEMLGRKGIKMGIQDPDKAWVEHGLYTTWELIKIEA